MRSEPRKLLGAIVLLLTGCSESPPVIPDDYGPQDIAGWPPPTVYSAERMHPANRWFHRSFSSREEDRTVGDLRTDVVFSELSSPTPVDRAEIRALIDAIADELEGLRDDVVTRTVLRADLLRQSEYWRLENEEPLAEAHESLAASIAHPRDEWPESALPLPLRSPGAWKEAPRSGETRPRVFFNAEESTAAIVFEHEGAPTEWWTTTSTEDSTAFGVYRFDRAAWPEAAGPWKRLDASERVTILGLGDRHGERLSGRVGDLCSSCHTPEKPFASRTILTPR